MKALNNVFLIISFLGFYSIQSQQIVETSFIHDGFTLGKSSDNSYTRSQPATINITLPSNDTITDSYSIDAYLAYDAKLNDKWSASFQVERHKNTLIAQEQDKFRFGIALKKLWEFGNNPDPVTLATGGIITYPTVYLKSEFNLKRARDFVKDTEGMQLIAAFNVELPNPSCKLGIFEFLRPFNYFPLDKRKEGEKGGFYASDLIQIYHTHNVGIEHIGYEDLTLLNTSFSLKVFPFSGLLFKEFKKYGILELGYSYVGRTELSSSNSNLFVGPLKTFNTQVNFWFDKNKKRALSIGYEYLKGGDPLKGLDENEFGQFAITALIKQ